MVFSSCVAVKNDYCKKLFLLVCVFVVNHNLSFASATAKLHQASEFSRYTLIEPKFYYGREEREILTTKQEDGKHAEYLSITYRDDNKNYILDLQLNKKLIPKSYFTAHQENGKNVVKTLKERNVENCNYHGKLRGVPDSWAALSTCNEVGFRGVVYNGNETHYLDKSSIDNLHYLYKHSDLVNSNQTCGYDENHHFKYKRSAEQIRGPQNASRKSRYVELVMVVDRAKYQEMGEDLHKVEQYVISIVNIVNGLYVPLNIYIALVGIVVWTEIDQIQFSPSSDTTLSNFLHYRRESLLKQHPNDHAQLLTKIPFENGIILKVLKGPICTTEYSGGIVFDLAPLGLVAGSVAHAMGHNFGMEHDSVDCDCPEEKCIMASSASSTAVISHWSSCSLQYLALAFDRGMDYCLHNKPDFLLDSPTCGNGFVESGEDCDCGLPGNCNNPCCNATSCMFRDNATCATGECCDLKKCSVKEAGRVCRSADYECDLPEYCTGTSEYCPNDVFKMDSELCADGQAYCYQGSCRTPSDQCKLLWGQSGESAKEKCYSLNTKGSRHGNCGYNRINQTYLKCNEDDILCGMLHCKHLNDRLEFGMESVSILGSTFINHEGEILPCKSAMVDLGIGRIDPGLTPDGSKCGDSKMCVNQKCVLVSVFRNSSNNCPNNCNGNGVCNSLGHCHCNSGFAFPLCQNSGFGGSQDSGPTINLKIRVNNALFKIASIAATRWYNSLKNATLQGLP